MKIHMAKMARSAVKRNKADKGEREDIRKCTILGRGARASLRK